MNPEKRTPGGHRANDRAHSGELRPKYSTTTPKSFWSDFDGLARMGAPGDGRIHRNPSKPADTLWRPDRGRA